MRSSMLALFAATLFTLGGCAAEETLEENGTEVATLGYDTTGDELLSQNASQASDAHDDMVTGDEPTRYDLETPMLPEDVATDTDVVPDDYQVDGDLGQTTSAVRRCTQGEVRRAAIRRIIRRVFGRYARQAIRVARCESGGSGGTRAVNGQYRGLFQMGQYERARYGHSRCAETQVRAAHRYFVASGRDWSPWACRP